MATLTIRDFDDELKVELRVRAARHGRSLEAEVREILRTALKRPVVDRQLGTWIRQQFSDMEDPPFEIPPRTELARAVEFPE